MSPFSVYQVPEPLSAELDIGERVLWTGQPSPTRMRCKDLPLLWFSLPFGAFMSFWMWGVGESLRRDLAAGRTPSLFSVSFPAFGLIGAVFVVLMFLAPWVEAAIARRTFYGLTDRRALVVVASNKKKVRSLSPQEFSLQRRDLSTESGDLILKQETTGTGDDQTTTGIGFFGIPDAHEVERIARELINLSR